MLSGLVGIVGEIGVVGLGGVVERVGVVRVVEVVLNAVKKIRYAFGFSWHQSGSRGTSKCN